MENRLVQSQPPMSDINYHWICLFNWCENDPNPFDIYVRENANGVIPESWYSKAISVENRHQRATFKPMNSQTMYVFAKIEFGKSE